jgi:hypothetical protein
LLDALHLKNLHKFAWVHLAWKKHYQNGSLPSSKKKDSFLWKDILKLLGSFKGMAMVNLQDGATCLLWDNLWHNMVSQQVFP